MSKCSSGMDWQSVLRLLLFKLVKEFDDLLTVFVGVHLRVFVDNGSVNPDNERPALARYTSLDELGLAFLVEDRFTVGPDYSRFAGSADGHAERRRHLAIKIRKQREVQIKELFELPVRLDLVAAHTDDFYVAVGKRVHVRAKLLCLFPTVASKVAMVEVDDKILRADMIS